MIDLVDIYLIIVAVLLSFLLVGLIGIGILFYLERKQK